MKAQGLGDSIKKFASATGITRVAEKISKITGRDCGCNKRRDSLNRAFPYKK